MLTGPGYAGRGRRLGVEPAAGPPAEPPLMTGRAAPRGGRLDARRVGVGSAEEDLGLGVLLRGDQLELTGALDERDPDDVGPAERDHLAEVALGHRGDRVEAESGGEPAVEPGRGAAALHVTEDHRAGLLARAGLDLLG